MIIVITCGSKSCVPAEAQQVVDTLLISPTVALTPSVTQLPFASSLAVFCKVKEPSFVVTALQNFYGANLELP